MKDLGGPILPHINGSSLQTAAGIRSTPPAICLIPVQETFETRPDYKILSVSIFSLHCHCGHVHTSGFGGGNHIQMHVIAFVLKIILEFLCN